MLNSLQFLPGFLTGHFFVYNTPFLSVASGEVFNAGQSFDAGDEKARSEERALVLCIVQSGCCGAGCLPVSLWLVKPLLAERSRITLSLTTSAHAHSWIHRNTKNLQSTDNR
ncbi:hypothetical protein MY092_005610 [Salmonella enterica]|nr:hypothetical protein [Salmonella enterica]